MTETADHQFFQKVLPECNGAAGKQLVVHSPTQACRGSFGPAITPTLSYDANGRKGRQDTAGRHGSRAATFGDFHQQ